MHTAASARDADGDNQLGLHGWLAVIDRFSAVNNLPTENRQQRRSYLTADALVL
ncbi:hypothetical protein KBY93_14735 [Synechococcus sp. J7-Johnson]|nr:hypothetical protein [Synechococcus sp. J7-Johnson]